MSDLISRQAAIDAINKAFERVFAWMPLPEPYMGTRSDTSDRRKD